MSANFLLRSQFSAEKARTHVLLFRAVFGEDAEIITVMGFTVTMYMVNKGLATVIVMIWNYVTKRWILKKGVRG